MLEHNVFVVGMDENGVGPLLGPLVGTAVGIELPSYDRAKLRRAGLRLGLGDSKAHAAFGKMAHAESVALALVERAYGAHVTDFDALVSLLAIDGVEGLRAPCPEGSAVRQCWSESIALPAFGGDVREGRRLLDRLERRGLAVRYLRTALACPGVLNRAVESGRHKFAVNLHMFERLFLDARTRVNEEIVGIAGMVGGIRKYGSFFAHLPAFDVIDEGASGCRYGVSEVGTLSFEFDADAGHLPVGLASMVGKYLRELSMERIHRFYRRHDAELPPASGYRDPVTKRFILATAALRTELAIPGACFERAR